MKIKLLILIMSGLFVASCSSSRYGHVPKVKKGNAPTTVQKTYKKKDVAALVVIPGKTVETTKPIMQEPTFTVLSAPKLKTTPKNTKSFREITKPVNKSETALIPLLKAKTNKHVKETAQKEAGRGGVWYIIVGLLFILLGILISIAIPVIGWILYVVGVIAIIYGLLALLGIV